MDSTITNTTDAAGNTEVRTGHFEWTNGTSSTIADYNFQTDSTDTIAAKELTEPSDIAALPELNGHGNMYSLHQAMVRDSSGDLKSLVEQFAAESNDDSREVLMSQILVKWVGIGRTFTDYGISNYSNDTMNVLEGYFAQYMISNPEAYTVPKLGPGQHTWIELTREGATTFNDAYHQIFEGYYGGLMAQTHLKYLYDKITCTWDMEKQQYNNDMTGVIAELQATIANNPEEGKQLLNEFVRSWHALNNGAEPSYFLPLREAFIQTDPNLAWVFDTGGLPVIEHVGQGIWPSSSHMMGTDGSEAIRGSLTEGDGCINGQYGNDVIYGTDRNETLISMDGDSLLFGGGGADQIWAGAGNDILDGGTGNDILCGETGNDTYIFRRGSGQDTIWNFDSTEGNTDTIWLGGNLTTDDVLLRRVGNNLVLKIKDTTDTLTVRDYFRDDSTLNKIEQISFMDGTVWGESDILQKTFLATEGDDILYGGTGNDAISGLGGNDSIYAQGDGDGTYLFTGPPVLSDRSSVGLKSVYSRTGLCACA